MIPQCELDCKKAVGIDNINSTILRMTSNSIVVALCHIINLSLDQGTFPYLWKTAKVFALHKGGPKDDFNTYRPISVLSITYKIIERHVHDCFYSYLSENSLLSNVPSGFRKLNSCFTCLTSMIDEWFHNINYHKLVACITLDFRKAFDNFSRNPFLSKLSLYVCDDIALQWFNSYLKKIPNISNK